MKWSQLNKRIYERLAVSVRDRVGFYVTKYRNNYYDGRGWIAIDQVEILNMPNNTFWIEDSQGPYIWVDNVGYTTRAVENDNLFSGDYLSEYFSDYLNLSIEEIIHSKYPMIRAVGMLDSRLGKRSLLKIDIANEHDLVKRFYLLRCDSDGIKTGIENIKEILTSRITGNWSNNYKIDYTEHNAISDEKLLKSKGTRDLNSILLKLENKEIEETNLDTDFSKIIFSGFNTSENNQEYSEFLKFINSKSKLLKNAKFLKGVIELFNSSKSWIRPYLDWSPKTHNVDSQFSSLIKYLLAKYEVPSFMESAWWTGNKIHQEWYKLLGIGGNIRKAESLPFPFTKKQGHYFLTAPSYYSIEAAIRWGQVHALDGDARLSHALLETRLINEFIDNHFWERVIEFFIHNPMLDTIHINPIIDYIWNQKYEDRIVFVERGVAENRGPAQPNFSMNGRTVNSLLRAVEAWHRQLGKEIKGGDIQWKKSNISDFKYIEGNQQNKNMLIWKIRELLSSKELIAEGREMKHCVATYAQSCANDICSIWTMDSESETGIEKHLTIEINKKANEVKQVRGRINRKATDKEKEILKRWATQAGIELADYI